MLETKITYIDTRKYLRINAMIVVILVTWIGIKNINISVVEVGRRIWLLRTC